MSQPHDADRPQTRLVDVHVVLESLRALVAVHRQRRYLALHVVYTLVAVALCFVPLLNLLGYEFSLVFALLATLTIGPISFRTLDAGLFATTHDVPGSVDDEVLGPGKAFAWLGAAHLLLLAGPLLVISFNALFVRNCDYLGGLAVWVVLPCITVLWATLSSLVSWGLVGGRRYWRGGIYLVFVLGSLAGTATHLALSPPIVAVSPWAGWFAGSLYDEALALPDPLLAYRALQVLLMVALVGALEIAWRMRRGLPLPFGLRALCMACAIAVVAGHAHHRELGYSLTHHDIQAELGGRLETEHFVIYHPTVGDWPERIEAIAEDHEFRHWQLREFFQLEPDEKIVSYIYPSPEIKGRLMGARNTRVAKLWLGEIHITYGEFGDPVLAHELAHVFTAPFGSGPLHLSTTWGIVPNMGLVEGVATAAEWGGREFTPHGWSAALHRLELAPPIEAILSAQGFWSRHSRTVYTVMGSFVRWLVDTRGIDKFKQAYGDGDLEGVYGESVTELAAQWRAFLDEVELSDEDLALASYYFDRPSIFGKVCARNIAERRLEVDRLQRAGRDADAIAAMEDIIELDPDDPNNRHALMSLLITMKRYDEARAIAMELLELEGLGAVRRAQLQTTLGDLQWRDADFEAALVTWSTLLADGGLPPGDERALRARVLAVQTTTGAAREALRRYLLDPLDPARRLVALESARRAAPDHALVGYLMAVVLSGLDQWAEVRRELAAVTAPGGLEDPVLRERARTLDARAAFFLGELADADRGFEALSRDARFEGDRADAEEWRERITWKRSAGSRKDAAFDHARPTRTRRAARAMRIEPRQLASALALPWLAWNVAPDAPGCLRALPAESTAATTPVP